MLPTRCESAAARCADHDLVPLRAAALWALRDLVLPDARAATLTALGDPEPAVRREAVGVLGYLKDGATLPTLMPLGADSDMRKLIRWAAACCRAA